MRLTRKRTHYWIAVTAVGKKKLIYPIWYKSLYSYFTHGIKKEVIATTDYKPGSLRKLTKNQIPDYQRLGYTLVTS